MILRLNEIFFTFRSRDYDDTKMLFYSPRREIKKKKLAQDYRNAYASDSITKELASDYYTVLHTIASNDKVYPCKQSVRTLTIFDIHFGLYAAEKNSVYGLHSDFFFYTLPFYMMSVLLYLQEVYLFSTITLKCFFIQ